MYKMLTINELIQLIQIFKVSLQWSIEKMFRKVIKESLKVSEDCSWHSQTEFFTDFTQVSSAYGDVSPVTSYMNVYIPSQSKWLSWIEIVKPPLTQRANLAIALLMHCGSIMLVSIIYCLPSNIVLISNTHMLNILVFDNSI